jgi:hypothetical protein
VQTIL